MTTLTTFPISITEPLPGDDRMLARWTLAHLADCEEWLVRRRMLAACADLLRTFRRTYDQGGDRDFDRDLADFVQRRMAVPRIRPDDETLAAVVGRLGRDLSLYGPSLRAGSVHDLTVVPVTQALTSLYLVATRELFLPDWQLATVSERLFGPSELFPVPPSATLSWLFFQSLALTGTPKACTTAAILQIRESD